VVTPVASGVHLESVSQDETLLPPLSDDEVAKVFNLVRRSEALFGPPQDMEWTFSDGELYALQSRPITTLKQATIGDQRPWYLSLRRSVGNLKRLRHQVEDVLIPAMAAEADQLASLDLTALSVKELKAELVRRAKTYRHWKDVYWSDFIPLAHGIRLFGVMYNDALKPRDPYEIMDLLGASGMLSVARNRKLEAMAAFIRKNPGFRNRCAATR
jgi:rifampicin phosphotransferase